MENKVYSSQSIFNVVIQNTGNIDNTFETVLLNNMSITDTLIVGEDLKFSGITHPFIVDYFAIRKPATGSTEVSLASLYTEILGIGTMGIESTFIIA